MGRYPITINNDGTVQWHTVETGKTRVLAMNRERKIIVLHVAGHNYTSGQTRAYGAAKVTVHEYEDKVDSEYDNYIYLKELFGIVEYSPRGNNWRLDNGD